MKIIKKCETDSRTTHISIAVSIIHMGHEGKTLSLHGIAAFPQALDFLAAQWAVCFTCMHVDLVCRLEAPVHIKSLIKTKILDYSHRSNFV
jgi:hypothetical protein